MESLKKNLLPVTTFIKIDVRRLFRDKVAIFFVFAFPMIFLIIFGFIFGGNNDVSFRVALLNESKSSFAKDFVAQTKKNDIFKLDDAVTTMDQAKEKMNRGQLDATIVLPKDFGETQAGQDYPSGQAQVIYDQSNDTAGQTLSSILTGIFKGVNEQIAPSVTPYSVKAQSTATKGLTQFDYVFAGIMGFTILSLGVFGPTNVFPRLKQRGVLRRYQTTTLKVWQYFVGNVLSNAIVGLIALVIMFAIAVLLFDLNMRGNYFVLGTVVVFGTIMLFGIGLAIGGWARNENQAAPLAQIATLPMMFLSGVFFPTFLMPEFLQAITRYIPLTPVVDSVRLVVTENASLASLWPQLAVMGGWTIVIYVLAFRVFRWE